jgi:hypothetical protein
MKIVSKIAIRCKNGLKAESISVSNGFDIPQVAVFFSSSIFRWSHAAWRGSLCTILLTLSNISHDHEPIPQLAKRILVNGRCQCPRFLHPTRTLSYQCQSPLEVPPSLLKSTGLSDEGDSTNIFGAEEVLEYAIQG